MNIRHVINTHYARLTALLFLFFTPACVWASDDSSSPFGVSVSDFSMSTMGSNVQVALKIILMGLGAFAVIGGGATLIGAISKYRQDPDATGLTMTIVLAVLGVVVGLGLVSVGWKGVGDASFS